jgi:hypothetical protein
MSKYEVQLVALANMSARVTIEAESEKEAELKALEEAKSGNVLWNYDGISSDDTIEVGE